MKKTVFTIFFALSSAVALAQFNPQGATTTVSTISQEKDWKDDQMIVLQGKIVEQYDEDDFLFQDATGTIKVEIDQDVWQGLNVSPQDTIKIYGEVDKSLTGNTEIEVHRVERAQ